MFLFGNRTMNISIDDRIGFGKTEKDIMNASDVSILNKPIVDGVGQGLTYPRLCSNSVCAENDLERMTLPHFIS